MKKKLSLLLAVVIATVSFATGVFASDTVSTITAYLNKSLAIKVNGTTIQPKETDGSRIYPIVYNGRTYVPARAIAEALGATAGYDNSGNGTVIINSTDDNAGRPVNDANPTGTGTTTSTTEPKDEPTPDTSATTTATGSITSPIPMNQKFTWSSTYTYKDTSYSGTYSATVKSAKPISRDAIEDLGFKRPEESTTTDYLLVTLAWDVKNAKCISLDSDSTYMLLSQFAPDIWGSTKTDGSKYIIGGTDYGFDASMLEKIRAVTASKKLKAGESGSFSAEGQFILPILKNTTNYLIIQDSGTRLTDYEKSKIHFKLN